MKFLTSIIAGVIVGALGVYFTLDWQEEELIYSITSPAKFGEINYQNVHIVNSGWNPAINIKIYINHPNILFENIQSQTTLKDLSTEKDGLVSIERIRRDETIIISLAYTGQPLFGNELKIASDRSIAVQTENVNKEFWTDFTVFLGIWVAVSIILSILVPAYKEYKRRAKEAKQADE